MAFTFGLSEAVFVALSAIIIGSAFMVIRAKELIHATIWLAAALLGTAGVFLHAGAEFVATVQILVYVGAVVTLFLFTVMLTIPSEVSAKDALADIDLPLGVSIEHVEDLQSAIPGKTVGVGPYKGRNATRLPVKKPPTYYGLAMEEDVK